MHVGRKWALMGVVACGIAVAPQVNALTINLAINDGQSIGYVNPGVDFGNSEIPGYINPFVTMGLNTSMGPITYANHINTWFRNGNSFSPMDLVSTSPNFGLNSGGTVTSFNVVSGEEYLVGKYDGPNGGLEVWYVGNLVGDMVTIPASGDPKGLGGNYGLSGSWLVYADAPSVPDGGTTILLLGGALSCLGLLRKKIAR